MILGLACCATLAAQDGRAPAAAPRLEPLQPDLPGLRRDTAYFLGYQFAAVALIGLWPREQTNYDGGQDIGWDSWAHNVTHPQWDKDRALVNYVLHPYWGAAYYMRARARGLDGRQSFWYSALLSTIFEFGAEAMVENVSYQDLLVTPLLGSLLGEHVFRQLRQRLLDKPEPLQQLDRIALVLIDPLGAINSSLDRLLGAQARLRLLTPLDGPAKHSCLCHATPGLCPPAVRHAGTARCWGLQLQVRW